MGKKEKIEDRAWELACIAAREEGLVPVDAEYVKDRDGYALLIYIDKEGGVTIDDCEAFSKRLDPVLDEENFISDPYTLVVSSPGLGRKLKRPRDFIFASGKEVDVKTYAPVDGEKNFTGILCGYDDESVTLQFPDGTRTFLKKDIALIALAVDF